MQPTVTRTVLLNGAKPDFVHKKLRVWLENRFGLVGSSKGDTPKESSFTLTVNDASVEVLYGFETDVTLFSLTAAITSETLTLTVTDVRQVIGGMGTFLVSEGDRFYKFESAINAFVSELSAACIN